MVEMHCHISTLPYAGTCIEREGKKIRNTYEHDLYWCRCVNSVLSNSSTFLGWLYDYLYIFFLSIFSSLAFHGLIFFIFFYFLSFTSQFYSSMVLFLLWYHSHQTHGNNVYTIFNAPIHRPIFFLYFIPHTCID